MNEVKNMSNGISKMQERQRSKSGMLAARRALDEEVTRGIIRMVLAFALIMTLIAVLAP